MGGSERSGCPRNRFLSQLLPTLIALGGGEGEDGELGGGCYFGSNVLESAISGFIRKDALQGCINCVILLSGIGAHGVSPEHMENMEMFSCSPT